MTAHDLKHVFVSDPDRFFSAIRAEKKAGRWFCPMCQSAGAMKHKTPDLSTRGPAIACFKCGGTWDVYSLVMELYLLSFSEARKMLLGIYGLAEDSPLPERCKTVTIPKQAKTKRHFATLDEAISTIAENMAATMGENWTRPIAVGRWAYGDAMHTTQVRFQANDGTEKSYRPFYCDDHGWVSGAPPRPWPLYRLPDIPAGADVWVAEGEKCAEALRGIGLAGTTSLSGAGAADKADWSVLAGHRVRVLADNDAAGEKYARAVAEATGGIVVRLPGLGEGEDVADWLAQRGDVHPALLAEELEEIANQ